MTMSVTPTRIVAASLLLVAILFAIGWATRNDPADKPLIAVLGGGFVFNYRIGEVTYGVTTLVQKPLASGSILEASFEDPAGGPPLIVRERVNARTPRYTLTSPPVRGVEAGRAYRVSLRVRDRQDKTDIWSDEIRFTSQIDDAAVPDQPLTVGPGYARNPATGG